MKSKTLFPVLAFLYAGCAIPASPVKDATKTRTLDEKVVVEKTASPLWLEGTLHHFTPEELRGGLLKKSPIPLFVDFYAEWCEPCKEMAVPYERAAKAFSSRASFAKYDVDEDKGADSPDGKPAKRIIEEFGVKSFPTVVLFEKGKETCRFGGYGKSYDNERKLRKRIADCLAPKIRKREH